jgi:tetratricopeptide (TPR) repeat protein
MPGSRLSISIRRWVPLALILAAAPALAQNQRTSTEEVRPRRLAEIGKDDGAGPELFDRAESAGDARIRLEAAYLLAEMLERNGLLVSALIKYSELLKAGETPFRKSAVERLLSVQQKLGDEYLVPNFLAAQHAENWPDPPEEVRSAIRYLVAGIRQRQGKLEEAFALLERVEKASPLYPKSRYLLGVVVSDPKFPGGPQPARAVQAFQEVLQPQSAHQRDWERTRELALLGLGRIYYGGGEYAKASQAYEQLPRFSEFWDQALFENGFARFRNGDPGAALGSLQALHAPQFEGAFQPESWILKATIYYFNCLHDEAKASLQGFDSSYLPMGRALESLLTSGGDPAFFFAAVQKGDRIPKAVLLWVRNNERMLGLFRILAQMDREITTTRASAIWMKSKLGPDLINTLEQNRATVTQVAGQLSRNRLEEAARNIKSFADQAEIIRFETTKAEKELAELGVDQKKILESQSLGRPPSPGDDWNYWRFDGEFWLDEIGYYQYTLKYGCPQPRASRNEDPPAKNSGNSK